MTDIDRWNEQTKSEADDVLRRARAAADNMAQVRGQGTVGNGSITATVDAAGHLRDLKFTPAATKWGQRIPALILEATQRAEQDAAEQTAKIMRPITEDPRTKSAIAATRELFGTTGSAKPKRRPATAEDEDAHYANLRIFE